MSAEIDIQYALTGSTRNRLDLAPSRPFLKAPTSFSITSTKNIMSFGFDLGY